MSVAGALALVMLGTAVWMLAPALGVADAASLTDVAVTPATNVTGSGATLNGTLNPNGDAYSYQFEYGTTTSYGSFTQTVSAPSGTTGDVDVSQAITNLESGTLYHYALIVTDTTTNQTTTSTGGTFTTEAPPDVGTPTAAGVGASSATLNGDVNPEGTAVTDCHFDYGTDQSLGTHVACDPSPGSGSSDVAVSGALTGLLPGTEYFFQLDATNAAGTSNSTIQDFTTAALAPTVTPAPPTSVSSTGVTLNGAINPNGAATSYSFQYGLADGQTPSYPSDTAAQMIPAGTSPTSVSAPISGLQPGATYNYRIAADNSVSTTYENNQTIMLPSAAPSVTTGDGVASSDTTASLNGTVNPNGADTTYWFAYGTTPGNYPDTTTPQDIGSGTNPESESAAIPNLIPGTTYYFVIEATNSNSNSNSPSIGAVQKFTTEAALPDVTASVPQSSITSTSATLTGTVNPNGAPTTYYFQYGTSDSPYSNSTNVESAGSGTDPVDVTAPISGLQPGVVYYYRLVATNSGGQNATNDGPTFQTLSAAPTVTTDNGVATSDMTATLNGTVNPNGADTTYWFAYGTTAGNYPDTTPTQDIGSGTNPESESAPIQGLAPGTTYYFVIEATNANSNLPSIGKDHKFTTDPAPPDVTASVNNSSITSTSALLTGTIDPNGAPTTYYFQYGTSDSPYSHSTDTESAGSGTSTTDVVASIPDLRPGVTYHYRLVATNSAGQNATTDQTFQTLSAVPAVTTGTGTATDPRTATLNGTVNPNGADTTYWFAYGTSNGNYPDSTTPQDIGSGTDPESESASIPGLTPGTTYYFVIEASNSNGTSIGKPETFTTPPAAPDIDSENVPMASITSTGATLTGTINPNGADTSYYFQYGTSSSPYSNTTTAQDAGSGTSPTDVSVPISGLQPGAVYHVRLVAVNTIGHTYGNDMTFQALSAAPAVTTGDGVATSDTTATLNGLVNPNGADTTYTFVYGTTAQYGNITNSTDIGGGTNPLHASAQISNLAPATTYHFAIEATNSNSNLPSIGEDHKFTTLPAPAAVQTTGANAITSTTATLTGTLNPNGYPTSYSFQWGLTTSYGQATPAQSIDSGNTPTDVSADISGLQPGATYHYRLVTDNPGGESFGSDQTFTAAAAAPQVNTEDPVQVTATTATLRASINPNGADTDFSFDWGTTTSNDATTTSESIAAGTQAVTASTQLTGLTPGTTYYVRVTADNGVGSPSLGRYVSFTTLPAAPVVDTLGSNAITSNGATVAGSVNPNGADASYYFEYGTTTNYGHRTPKQDAGSETSSVSEAAILSDLKPGTKYHYRIVSTNSVGTGRGGGMTFTTAPGAPAATTGSAWGVRSDSVIVSARISAHGAATTYQFEYGRTRSYGHRTKAVSVGADASGKQVETRVTGLKPGTQYHWRVIATNSAGKTTGEDSGFTTRPATPGIVSDPATHVTDHSASVSGSLDSGGARSRWWFDYGTTHNYGKQTAEHTLVQSGDKKVRVHATLGQLQPGTLYHFRLVTANSSGFSFGPDETVTTLRAKSGLGMVSLNAKASRHGCQLQYQALDAAVHSHVAAVHRPLRRSSQCKMGDIVVSGSVSKLADGGHVKATFSGPAHRVVSAQVKDGAWKIGANLPGLFASRHWTLVVRFAGNKQLLPASVRHEFMLAVMGGDGSAQ